MPDEDVEQLTTRLRGDATDLVQAFDEGENRAIRFATNMEAVGRRVQAALGHIGSGTTGDTNRLITVLQTLVTMLTGVADGLDEVEGAGKGAGEGIDRSAAAVRRLDRELRAGRITQEQWLAGQRKMLAEAKEGSERQLAAQTRLRDFERAQARETQRLADEKAAAAKRAADAVEAAAKREADAVKRATDQQRRAAQQARQEAPGRIARGAESVGRGMTGVSATVLGAGIFAVKDGLGFDEAYTEVRKFVQGTEAEVAGLKGRLRAMALDRVIDTNFEDLASVASFGSQLGIARENLTDFVAQVVYLGKAGDIAGEDGAAGLAKISAAMKIPQRDIGRLASSLVKMGEMGSSSLGDILDVSKRLASEARLAKLDPSQVFAFANAVVSLGQEPEAAGTALATTFAKIDRAVNEGGANLRTYAQVAGMSAKEFARAYREDAGKAVQQFFAGLDRQAANAGATDRILKSLGISNIREATAVKNLAAGHQLLAEAMEASSEAYADGDLARQKAAIAATSQASAFRQLRREITEESAALGEELAPLVLEALRALISLTRGTRDLVHEFRNLSPEQQKVILGLVGILAAIGPLLIGGVKLFETLQAIGGASIALRGGLSAAAISAGATETAVAGITSGATAAAGHVNSLTTALAGLKALGVVTLSVAVAYLAYQLGKPAGDALAESLGKSRDADQEAQVGASAKTEANKVLPFLRQYRQALLGKAGAPVTTDQAQILEQQTIDRIANAAILALPANKRPNDKTAADQYFLQAVNQRIKLYEGQAKAQPNKGMIASDRRAADLSSREGAFRAAYASAKAAGDPFPEVAAAQWALESDWGRKPSGKNNFFGIKAVGSQSGTMRPTTEYVNGRKVRTTARFADFDTPEEGFGGRLSFLRRYSRYNGYFGAGSPEEAAKALQAAGYATDPRYAELLLQVMGKYGGSLPRSEGVAPPAGNVVVPGNGKTAFRPRAAILPPIGSQAAGRPGYADQLAQMDTRFAEQRLRAAEAARKSGVEVDEYSLTVQQLGQRLLLTADALKTTGAEIQRLTGQQKTNRQEMLNALLVYNRQRAANDEKRKAGEKLTAADQKAEAAAQANYAQAKRRWEQGNAGLKENQRVHAQAVQNRIADLNALAQAEKGQRSQLSERRQKFLREAQQELESGAITRPEYEQKLKDALDRVKVGDPDRRGIQEALDNSVNERSERDRALRRRTGRMDKSDFDARREDLAEELAQMRQAGQDETAIRDYESKQRRKIDQDEFAARRRDQEETHRANVEAGTESIAEYKAFLTDMLRQVKAVYGETSAEAARLNIEIMRLDWETVDRQASEFREALDEGRLSLTGYVVALRNLQSALPATSDGYRKLERDIDQASKRIRDNQKRTADEIGERYADMVLDVATGAKSVGQAVGDVLKDSILDATRDWIKRQVSKMAFKVLSAGNEEKLQQAANTDLQAAQVKQSAVQTYQAAVNQMGGIVQQFVAAVQGWGGAVAAGSAGGSAVDAVATAASAAAKAVSSSSSGSSSGSSDDDNAVHTSGSPDDGGDSRAQHSGPPSIPGGGRSGKAARNLGKVTSTIGLVDSIRRKDVAGIATSGVGLAASGAFGGAAAAAASTVAPWLVGGLALANLVGGWFRQKPDYVLKEGAVRNSERLATGDHTGLIDTSSYSGVEAMRRLQQQWSAREGAGAGGNNSQTNTRSITFAAGAFAPGAFQFNIPQGSNSQEIAEQVMQAIYRMTTVQNNASGET